MSTTAAPASTGAAKLTAGHLPRYTTGLVLTLSVLASVSLFAGVEDGHDARMVEARGRLGLALETGAEHGVGGELGAEQLDRHGSVQAQVVAPTHLGHAAATETRAQLVAATEDPVVACHVLFSPERPQRSGQSPTVSSTSQT